MTETTGTYDGEQIIIATHVLRELSDRTIAFQVAYARLAGSASAGLFLSQAMYWTVKLPKGRDGWFYKTGDEWREETCLTRSEQENARKRLIALGVLEEQRRGVPAKLWYRIRVGRLTKLIAEQSQTSLQDPANKSAESDKLECEIQQTNTKTTAQKTTKEKKSATHVASDNHSSPSVQEPSQPKTNTRRAAAAKERTRGNRRTWAAVDGWYSAKNIKRGDVPEKEAIKVYDALAPLPNWVGKEDVMACIRYLQSDPFWREPGRLTVSKLATVILEWDGAGRLESVAPKQNGKNGTLTMDDLLSRIAAHERNGE